MHQVAGGRQQLEAEHEREEAAEHEHERDRDQVEDRDPLVVLGEQPRPDAVVGVEVVGRRHEPVFPCAAAAPAALGVGAERLDVGDQLQDLLLAELPLEGRHDRLEARHDLGLRVQDRLAQVVVVGRRPCCRPASVDRRADEAGERRDRARRPRLMAGDAAELARRAPRPPAASDARARRRRRDRRRAAPHRRARPGSRPAPSRRPGRSSRSAPCRSTRRRRGGSCPPWSPRTRSWCSGPGRRPA